MTWHRMLTIGQHELRTQVSGPLFWFMIGLVVLVTLMLNPDGMIPSGDAATGLLPYINSSYALANIFSLSGSLVYTFMASLLAGLSVIRDDEAQVGELLHSTPLTRREYVGGKLGGVLAALAVVMTFHLVFAMWRVQFAPVTNPEMRIGPFELGNFVAPFFAFLVPGAVCCACVSFAIGERSRQPMLVYAFPIVAFLGILFFLWTSDVASGDTAANHLMMIAEPWNLRWLRQTVYMVDRGVAFYNEAPLALDGTFWLSRLFLSGLAGVAVSYALFRREGVDTWISRQTRRRARRVTAEPADSVPASFMPLGDLGMRTKKPDLWPSLWYILLADLRELRGQPGLYVLVLFMVMMVLEFASEGGRVLGIPEIQTAGNLAIGGIDVLSSFAALLLLFYTVESHNRERLTGFASIAYAAPFQTAALLAGKSLAQGVVVAVIVVACTLMGLNVLISQDAGRVEIGPFLLIWGLVLAPTYFCWNAFITAVFALVRERYTTYAIGLSALLVTVYAFQSGGMTWVFNWPLWGTLRWSDMGLFSLNGRALVLNRLLVLGVGVFFSAVALLGFARTERDAAGLLHRWRPRQIGRVAVTLAPFLIVPLFIGVYLTHEINAGSEGHAAEARAKSYWRQHVATWAGAPLPTILHVDAEVRLEPTRRRVDIQGTYVIANRSTAPLDALPFTVFAFDNVSWTIDGEAHASEDRAGLQVLHPARPMMPGDERRIGFSYSAEFPAGMTRNGGGVKQFILPSGAALNDFLPVPGFDETIGVDADNRPDPRVYPDDFWRGELPPISGNATAFTTRFTVMAPDGYTVNMVGTKRSERSDGGTTTSVWESDAPVKAVNLVAGRWDEKRQGGTAVFYHPDHAYNVDEMLNTLVAARERYSAWFYPYPWQELRLSEFPNMVTNAQGFPTNIPFSETSGFLSRRDADLSAAFVVTAHEAAHQWWANVLTPGEGPGADVLIEGMAHYATLLLHESEKGQLARIAFATRIEEEYFDQRRVDREQPLARTVMTTQADESVIYNKGAWAFWMLHNHLGREAMFAGLQSFIRAYLAPNDYPALHDLIETLRPFAADSSAYQALVDQWFFDVVTPEYRLDDVRVEQRGDQWFVEATAVNRGTGTADVAIIARREKRFTDAYREGRITVRLTPGDPQPVSWLLDFKPQRLVVDPDAMVLQANRTLAVAELE